MSSIFQARFHFLTDVTCTDFAVMRLIELSFLAKTRNPQGWRFRVTKTFHINFSIEDYFSQ